MEDSIDILMATLPQLTGLAFGRQLSIIVHRKEFRQIEGGIWFAGSKGSPDFEHLLAVARKGIGFGFTVYILPNPKGIKSADIVFENNGVYRMYEVKTIIGNNSIGNRLNDSPLQANRILLHLTLRHNPRKMAIELDRFFNRNKSIIEVLIFYKRKKLLIKRNSINSNLWKVLMAFMKQ